jgi:hypothetical protein
MEEEGLAGAIHGAGCYCTECFTNRGIEKRLRDKVAGPRAYEEDDYLSCVPARFLVNELLRRTNVHEWRGSFMAGALASEAGFPPGSKVKVLLVPDES